MNSQVICVEESEKTKRAREKLKKRLSKLEKEITAEALRKKVIEIHDRISRHAANRVVLARKTISLFDNNQNTAKESNKVAQVALRIQTSNKIFLDRIKDFEGSLNGRSISIKQ